MINASYFQLPIFMVNFSYEPMEQARTPLQRVSRLGETLNKSRTQFWGDQSNAIMQYDLVLFV